MQMLLSFVRRHWLAFLIIALVLSGGVAYAVSPDVKEKAGSVWRATLAWAGIGEQPAGNDSVYWCPMHPQIKSNKENAVCPICNMALVELEGGGLEASQDLTLTAQQIQQAGVVTQPVMYRTLYRQIDTTGRIDYDERRLAKITSWIRGKSRIEELYVSFVGQQVEQGQPLAELYSPELMVAQQEYLTALRTVDGRSSAGLGESLLEAARQKLKYQGLSDEQIEELVEQSQVSDHISILAPISGTVIKRHVQEGQYVSEGDVLFEIADLQELWVFADIYEDELPLIEVGMPVELSVSNSPGESFMGEIAFIDPMVRPTTRTVPVRIDVDNREGKLLPGMFARVRLRRDFEDLLAVPEHAVLWSGERSVAILGSGAGTFRPTEIRTGMKWLYEASAPQTTSIGFGEGRVRFHEVLEGLAPGDEVVTAGAFLLNAESQFQGVLAKMLPPASEQVTLEEVLGEALAAQLRDVLDSYFGLSAALAADQIDESSYHLESLLQAATRLEQSAEATDAKELASDAGSFRQHLAELSSQPIEDARDARARFGRISRELTQLLAKHGGKTLFGEDLFQFECGMAKVGYERWLWWSPEIHNPYMGQKMLSCGTQLDVLEP